MSDAASVEISRTVVFNAFVTPWRLRGTNHDDLDVGAQHNVEVVFDRKNGREIRGTFRTAIGHYGNGDVIGTSSANAPQIRQDLEKEPRCASCLALEQAVHPFAGAGGQRPGADASVTPRHALVGALGQKLLAATGFTKRISAYLSPDCSPRRMET